MSKQVEQREIPVSINYMRLKEADDAGKFYKVLEGSSGSAKTYSILQYLIEKALKKKRRIRGLRFDQRTCKDSIIADFKRIMQDQYCIWEDKAWNASNFDYTFANGSTFHFRGCSEAQKLHGPRYDISWANEVMELPYESHRQIVVRTAEEVIYDFNPSLTQHWIFEKVAKRDDCAWIHSTFVDNPFLPESDRNEILALDPGNYDNVRQGTADKWAWEVYGLGRRGRREGAIFGHYDIIDHWPSPNVCDKWGFGLDFGYSNDPCAMVECAIWQGKLCLREWFYETGLTTIRSHQRPNFPSIQGNLELMNFDKAWKVVADGARPDQISELVNEGFNVWKSEKGKGSVLAGIDLIKRFPICVHRNSMNMQMELQQYAWKKHASGTVLGEPEDKYNHLIDATRYWAMDELSGWQPNSRGLVMQKAVGKKRKVY